MRDVINSQSYRSDFGLADYNPQLSDASASLSLGTGGANASVPFWLLVVGGYFIGKYALKWW